MINQDQVIEELKKVKYPGFSRDIVSFGIIQSIDVREDKISVLLMIKSQDTSVGDTIKVEAKKQLQESFPKHQIDIGLQSQKPSEFKASAEPKASFLANAKYKIAVACGNGGVVNPL
jgi:ATP-binding protein involved in chromosome partitioning